MAQGTPYSTSLLLAPPSQFLLANGPPIDVGNIGVGGQFSSFFLPPDPCVGGGTCQLDFSFSGFAAGFPAFGFGNMGDLPNLIHGPPIVPVGVFTNGPPIRQSGRIVAFDVPVVVGTWDVTISAAPEPRGVAVVLAMLLGVMVGSRRWHGVKP